MSPTIELRRHDQSVPVEEPTARPRGASSARRRAVLAIGTTSLDRRLPVEPLPLSQPGIARTALRSAVVLLLLLAGCTPSAPSANTSPSVTMQTAATSATPSPSAAPIDTTSWVVYKSKQYGFSLKHPAGWTVIPAKRDWTLNADAGQPAKGGEEGFLTPTGDVYVAVWSTPVTDAPETLEGVASWVERYCKQAGASCSGLDQSVQLCNGTDCGAGLVVTIDGKFLEAFFTGGKHKGRIVGVAVGRPEGHYTVTKYGGARRLLEGFLSGMGVCPARPDQTPPDCP